MNRYARQDRPACFMADASNLRWKAMDYRVASVITMTDKKDIYAVSRNQKAYIQYDNADKLWYTVHKDDVPYVDPSVTDTVRYTNSKVNGGTVVVKGDTQNNLYFKADNEGLHTSNDNTTWTKS